MNIIKPILRKVVHPLVVPVTGLPISGEDSEESWSSYWSPQTDEHKALMDVVSIKPSIDVQHAQNDFIYYLKGNNPDLRNVWAKLSCIMPMFAGMTEATDALLWWNNPNRTGILAGGTSPVYSLINGFVGNNSGYVDTGWNPSEDDGGLYTQNDCSIGVMIMNNRTANAIGAFGLTADDLKGTVITPKYTDGKYYLGMQGTYVFGTAVANINNLWSLTRSESTQFTYYRDRVSAGAKTSTSSAVLNGNVYLLGFNKLGTGATDVGSDTVGFFYAGSSIDQTDVNVMCDAIDNLLFAINLSTALFDYPADGDVIDEEVWTITNPQPLSVEFEQNNALIMRSLGVSSTAGANNIAASITMNYGVFAGSLMDIYRPTSYRSLTYLFGAANFFAIQRFNNIDQNLRFRIYNGTSYVYDLDTGEYEFIIFKIKYTPTHAFHFYKYINDAWLLVGSYVATNILGVMTSFGMTSTGTQATETHLRDIYITKKDFNTMIP